MKREPFSSILSAYTLPRDASRYCTSGGPPGARPYNRLTRTLSSMTFYICVSTI